MKKDLENAQSVTVIDLKKYLTYFSDEANFCWSLHSLKKLSKGLYEPCKDALYDSRNYEDLEYQLIMMNTLYDNEDYTAIKNDLLNKLMKRNIGFKEYLVIRHIIDFKHTSLKNFLDIVYDKMSQLDIVKICLMEEQSYLAYYYIKQANYCDMKVLELLYYYSPYYYYRIRYNMRLSNKQYKQLLLQNQY